MRIGILGDRGIPARYGGFSTLVEEISTRLVADHGHEVTVYCRPAYYAERPPVYKGVRLVYLPAPGGKLLESLVHTGISAFDAWFRKFDAVLLLDPGNVPFVPLLRLRGYPVALHTDGIGWKRKKWGPVARTYYRWSERFAAQWATRLVVDALSMRDYYKGEYGADSSFIPYGSRVGPPPVDTGLKRFDISAREYYLLVSRLEPDNNGDLILREFLAAGLSRPLIVVGSARYPSEFSRMLQAMSTSSIRFVGAIYDDAVLNGLYAGAYAYLHGHEVGGTNPSLLRAMDGGRPCVALDVVFNREVLADTGIFFSRQSGRLAEKLRALDGDPVRAEVLGVRSRARAAAFYRWDAVTDGYARLLARLSDGFSSAADASWQQEYQPEAFDESS